MTREKEQFKREMKVLAIDDEKTVLRLYESIIKDMGHLVFFAQTGEEARKHIAKEDFSLIILDLRLPDVYGMELLKEIKSKIGETSIVIITANPSLESSIDAIRTGGVYDYIVKPFHTDDFKMVIRRAVEKAELLHENKRLMKRLEHANKALYERVDELEKFAMIEVDFEKRMSALKKRIEELEKK